MKESGSETVMSADATKGIEHNAHTAAKVFFIIVGFIGYNIDFCFYGSFLRAGGYSDEVKKDSKLYN